MRIILSGGGTGGSVTPVLAVAEEIKKKYPTAEFLLIGTRSGKPEKEMSQNHQIVFKGIWCGKLRRYFSFKNIIDLFLIIIGFFQSIFIISRFKPQAVFSAGGFVAVPISFAAWFCRAPVFIHQQDIVPGLANKIIAPIAKKITVSFEESLKDYPKNKAILTGNPIRQEILKGNKQRAIEKFGLEKDYPVLLIVGGGTGALAVNQIIFKIISELSEFCQIIHLTGREKSKGIEIKNKRYHQYEFLSQEMADAFCIADLVVSRAGLGVLTELAALSKPTILIPIPNSHQQANANYFFKKGAAVVLNQETLTQENFINQIKNLLQSQNELEKLKQNISQLSQIESGKKISEIILGEV